MSVPHANPGSTKHPGDVLAVPQAARSARVQPHALSAKKVIFHLMIPVLSVRKHAQHVAAPMSVHRATRAILTLSVPVQHVPTAVRFAAVLMNAPVARRDTPKRMTSVLKTTTTTQAGTLMAH
jgi:hypothetical protein